MNFSRFVLILVLFFSIAAQGQTSNCIFDLNQERLRKSPDFLQAEAQTNALIQANVNQIVKQRTLLRNQSAMAELYTIPVVVHIIYRKGDETIGSPTNPSDVQIANAIQKLNSDFTGGNPGNVGAGTPIRFALSKRSPNCTSTNGIVRVDGSTITDYSEKGLAYNNSGYGATEADIRKKSNWPPEQYYNIWVVWSINPENKKGTAQGYAYHPSYYGISQSDGLFILPEQMSEKSSILTHEIGHAMGLYHTFEGDDNNPQKIVCPDNTNPSTQGDLVADTDPVKRFWECFADTDINPCTGQKFGGIQRNIMGYAACTDMFTRGQSDRMLATVKVARMSQVNSLGNTAPPSDGIISSSQTPKNIQNTNNNNNIGPCKVNFGNINYTSQGYSGDGFNYYKDNSCDLGTILSPSKDYTLSVTTLAKAQTCKAWIDFNNDGKFANEELILNTTSSNGDYTHTANILASKLNNGVAKNTILRLRIMSDLSSNSGFGPDSQLKDGQTEDFWINIETALNVSFGSINAQLKNNALHINWDTESESDNDHFLIEGSKDGSNFFTIKTVQTKAENGNSTSLIHYNENINNNTGTFASAAGIIIVALLILIAVVGNKKKLALASCIGILFLVACNKNDVQTINADNEIKFIRISQVDKNGIKNYSKTVQIVKK